MLYDFIAFRHHLFIKNGSSAFEEDIIGEPHEKVSFHALRIAKEYHELTLWGKLILSSFSQYLDVGSTSKNSQVPNAWNLMVDQFVRGLLFKATNRNTVIKMDCSVNHKFPPEWRKTCI